MFYSHQGQNVQDLICFILFLDIFALGFIKSSCTNKTWCSNTTSSIVQNQHCEMVMSLLPLIGGVGFHWKTEINSNTGGVAWAWGRGWRELGEVERDTPRAGHGGVMSPRLLRSTAAQLRSGGDKHGLGGGWVSRIWCPNEWMCGSSSIKLTAVWAVVWGSKSSGDTVVDNPSLGSTDWAALWLGMAVEPIEADLMLV